VGKVQLHTVTADGTWNYHGPLPRYCNFISFQLIFTASLSSVGRVAQSVQRLATGWTVRGSNPGGDEVFRTCPDQPGGLPSLLYNKYRVFPGGKERPGRDADPSPPSSAASHERVKLYLYSPYGPYCLYRASVPVQGCTLLFYHLQCALSITYTFFCLGSAMYRDSYRHLLHGSKLLAFEYSVLSFMTADNPVLCLQQPATGSFLVGWT